MLFVFDQQPTPIDADPADAAGTPGLVAAFRDAVAARREAELRCARLLARMGDDRAWERYGCTNVGEFGERHGLAAVEARALLDLGRALRLHPDLADEIRAGGVTVAAAACVSEVLTRPTLLRPDDDWRHWARTEPIRTLRRRIRARREQVRIGNEPACPVTVFVRPQARDDFERAREIASSRAGRPLTHGETFETVVDHFLDSFDFARVEPGSRRAPNTRLYRSRYVPMEVRREIYARQGFQCAVPFCENTMFLEKAHLVAHASGGHREADNLLLLCSVHHVFLDGGVIRVEGTASEPRFLDRDGRDLATRGRAFVPRFEDDDPDLPDDPDLDDEGSPDAGAGPGVGEAIRDAIGQTPDGWPWGGFADGLGGETAGSHRGASPPERSDVEPPRARSSRDAPRGPPLADDVDS